MWKPFAQIHFEWAAVNEKVLRLSCLDQEQPAALLSLCIGSLWLWHFTWRWTTVSGRQWFLRSAAVKMRSRHTQNYIIISLCFILKPKGLMLYVPMNKRRTHNEMDFSQIQIETVLSFFFAFTVFKSRLPLYVLFITRGGYFLFCTLSQTQGGQK